MRQEGTGDTEATVGRWDRDWRVHSKAKASHQLPTSQKGACDGFFPSNPQEKSTAQFLITGFMSPRTNLRINFGHIMPPYTQYFWFWFVYHHFWVCVSSSTLPILFSKTCFCSVRDRHIFFAVSFNSLNDSSNICIVSDSGSDASLSLQALFPFDF